MTPEMVQWLIYAGLVVAGWFLRHKGIQLPGLPQIPAPQAPSLAHFPKLNALLGKLGPQAEGWLLEIVQQELQKMASPAPPLSQTPGNGK